MTYPRALILIIAFSVLGVASVQHLPNQSTSKNAQSFVSSFYAWYVPQALATSATPAWGLAVRAKEKDFSPELAKLLAQDVAAQAKCEDLIGLDFDPILNSQDPADEYSVGAPTGGGLSYTIQIYRVDHGRRAPKASLSVEVAGVPGGWRFQNFIYPDGTNLLSILKSSRSHCDHPRSATSGPSEIARPVSPNE